MKLFGGKRKIKSNSALAIAAGCAVVFMLIATVISTYIYNKRMAEAEQLLAEAKYSRYDSYVVMISSDDESDFWQEVYLSAKAYGEANNVYVDMISESLEASYTKLDLLEMAIESACDAIFLEGDDSLETAQLLEKAKRENIAVFTMYTDVNIENRVSYIGANSYSIASLYGASLVNTQVRQNKAMVVGGNSISLSTANSFTNNLQTSLGDMELPNGNIEFDVRTVDSNDEFATEEFVQNLFKDNDLAPVVICLDEGTTAAFYQAMIDYNKVGQILLFGSNSTDAILIGIKQGVIVSSVYVDATSIGEAAAEAFVEYNRTGHVSDYVNVEASIIDATNVDDLIGEVENE